MKHFYVSLTFFFLLLALATQAQNLVPNPSFEDTIACPYLGEISDARHWINPTDYSPDYLNSCDTNTNSYSVPSNGYGFQLARTGEGYAGIITMIETNGREYIQTKLIDSLVAGKKYFVKFYVSLAEASMYSANKIGAYFSKEPISSTNSTNLTYSPQISNSNSSLSNKQEWVEVAGTLIATGGEHYLTIGNFDNDINTDTTHIGTGNWNASYHYIDDISVLEDVTGINQSSSFNNLNVFPNPSCGLFNLDLTNYNSIIKINIYNSLGVFMQATQPYRNINGIYTLDITSLKQGIYIITLESKTFPTIRQLLFKL